MIRADKIQELMASEVGFSNSTESGYDIVDADNMLSNSGLTFQSASGLVDIVNIKDCQNNKSITDVQFNALLESMRKTNVLNVCNKVVHGKSDFVSSLNLFPYEKSFSSKIEKGDKFACFEIERSGSDCTLSIPFVELSFDEDVTFDLYLYNSNLPMSPIETKSVVATAGESSIVTLDWIVADDTSFKGGKFYLGYFESDLGTASAYSKDFEISNLQVATPYYKVFPLSLEYIGTKIDIESKDYSSDTFGLNLGINVYSDYTELILRNKNIFWRAIQLQMHEEVLMLIKFSRRSNIVQRLGEDNIAKIDLELFGNQKYGIVGIQEKLNTEIESIRDTIFRQPLITRNTLR